MKIQFKDARFLNDLGMFTTQFNEAIDKVFFSIYSCLVFEIFDALERKEEHCNFYIPFIGRFLVSFKEDIEVTFSLSRTLINEINSAVYESSRNRNTLVTDKQEKDYSEKIGNCLVKGESTLKEISLAMLDYISKKTFILAKDNAFTVQFPIPYIGEATLDCEKMQIDRYFDTKIRADFKPSTLLKVDIDSIKKNEIPLSLERHMEELEVLNKRELELV